MKPDLTLYSGRKVTRIHRPKNKPGIDQSAWMIELEGGILVENKSADETIPPGDEIIGSRLVTVIASLRDTTIVFEAPAGNFHRVSFAPTYYTISDPSYGGTVYPQWPEELEEGGVPATPEGGISDQPQAGWDKAERELRERSQARRQQEAASWLKEEDEDAGTD
jgi:hypothetical protein